MSFKGVRPNENFETRGKTIRQLIRELKTFENHELEIRISIDGGDSHYPISIVGRSLNDMNGNGHIGILSYHGDV